MRKARLCDDTNFMAYIDCAAISGRALYRFEKRRCYVDANFVKILQSCHSISAAPFAGGRERTGFSVSAENSPSTKGPIDLILNPGASPGTSFAYDDPLIQLR